MAVVGAKTVPVANFVVIVARLSTTWMSSM